MDAKDMNECACVKGECRCVREDGTIPLKKDGKLVEPPKPVTR